MYTRVFQEHEGEAWGITKARAFREHLRTIPLWQRPGDQLAGALTELPGGWPVIVEIGIAENSIFVSEDPAYRGYLDGQVPAEILDYWDTRNLWGRTRRGPCTSVAAYHDISYPGHLSPSYRELLATGFGGILSRLEAWPANEWRVAAAESLRGVMEWITRWDALVPGVGRLSANPPRTFREALQLIWLAQQAIHIEGHGYSNMPDRLDQILYPFYRADRAAGRLTNDEALTLCENFILKMRDNTFWSVAHNLTQGISLGGSTPDGADQTNELSWLFLQAANNLSLPEPLIWIRWHPNIDQDFFDFCLETLAGPTCFPLMMSDTAVPAMFEALGVSRADAFNYVAVGCNELALPGQAYFYPVAGVDYFAALEEAMRAPAPTFDARTQTFGQILRRQVQESAATGLARLAAQRQWAPTPFTSCFFDGCIEQGHDLMDGTKYNTLCCGGIGFANIVDCLAALREVVYERRAAMLAEVAAACAANFAGHERLRAQLLAAPKHGNDDPRLRDLIRLVERLRDEPVKELRDPRDGTPFGNSHVVRSAAVLWGRQIPATPDGRLAGTPLASSVAASCDAERRGPTAALNSILALDPVRSWQSGYNVNLRFARPLLAEPANRAKVRSLLNSFFARGGQEMQINCVNTETLRAAQVHPDHYHNLVVRVAGFSEFFTKLAPDLQAEIIARTEHGGYPIFRSLDKVIVVVCGGVDVSEGRFRHYIFTLPTAHGPWYAQPRQAFGDQPCRLGHRPQAQFDQSRALPYGQHQFQGLDRRDLVRQLPCPSAQSSCS